MFTNGHDLLEQVFVTKTDIHPDDDDALFRDDSADLMLLTRSTRRGFETIDRDDGRVRPVVDVEVSSARQPSCTGRTRVLDTAGLLEKFRRRYQSGDDR